MLAAGKSEKQKSQLNMSGFTLLEMLVILSILSLLAGIAFPSVDKALRRQTFHASALQVEAGLRAARASAVRTGREVRIAPKSDRLGFSYGNVATRLPATMLLVMPNGGVAFYGDGSSSGGEISLTGAGFVRRWRIRPTTGLIEQMQ